MFYGNELCWNVDYSFAQDLCGEIPAGSVPDPGESRDGKTVNPTA